MSVTFTQISQTLNLAEKVKVYKELTTFCRDSNFYIFSSTNFIGLDNLFSAVYFDGEKYAGSYRNEKDAQKVVKDYLKLVGEEVEVVTEREDTASEVAKALKKMGVKYDRKKEDSIISKIPKVLDSMKLSPGAKRMLLRDRDFIADVLDDLGEGLQENRAKRDAMRAMGRRRGKDAADIDDFATDDDRKAADKNIMMQLRKAVSLRGMKPIEFADGKKAKINPKDAEKLIAIYDKLKPASKLQLQTVLAKSKRDFDKAVQKLKENEYFDESIEEGKMKQIGMYIDDIVTAMNKDRTLKPFAKKFKADAQKSKDPKKSLEKILPDYISGKQVAGLLNMGEEILSNDELEYIAEMIDMHEALPPHLAKLFDKDGNFKDPKKQKVFDRMMGDGIGKEITKKMGRIKFRVDANSAKKKLMVYVDQIDEKDAQRALKNHPAYVSGALRVIPEGEFTPHVMYDPKTGKAYKAEKPEDHERMSKMGYTHEKPKEVKEVKQPPKKEIMKVIGHTKNAVQGREALRKKYGVSDKEADDMIFKAMTEMKELDEAIKYTHVAVDAKGKIIGFASKADDAKDMARRNKGVVHKLKKPMSQKVGDMEINRPFNPVLKASMNFKDFMKSK